MRWRDIKTNPMTKADADENGEVLQLLKGGGFGVYSWSYIDNVVAWMPTSELPKFVPVPDPPEGYRLVVKGEAFDERRQVWSVARNMWTASSVKDYADGYTYAVPIDPPKPTYRPFKDAAEFRAKANVWWRFKNDTLGYHRPPDGFGDVSHSGVSWQESFETKVFCDDSPFGVKE